MTNNNNFAIVGMSCVYPGADDINTYWNNIKNKVDAITDVPENRWESRYYDPSSSEVDRFYCKRGGFIDDYANFDPYEFGIVPIAVQGTEPDHLITLKMAKNALTDAGVFDKKIPLDKTGIILGKGNYTGTGMIRLLERMRTGEHIANLLSSLVPDLTPAQVEKIRKGFQKNTGRYGPDTAMGLIPNLAASLVANRLNLGGTAYTIDAACASSLLAIDQGVKELQSGRCNMILAGGIHLSQNAPFYSVFTQLGALSRSQQIRPFDKNADGLLIGEGCGMVVLKRLDDALADDDRIYAVVKGVGVASDGAASSLMSPSVKGQSQAIEHAWDMAQMEKEVGYIEAHGTGTPLGDKTETETLINCFGSRTDAPLAGLGSVKSMIGHTMPAAGMAGLIKTALALYHGQIPPTLHCDSPLEALSNSRFMTIKDVIDWDQTELPRKAGVNAFGFGGINSHVVLEGFNAPDKKRSKLFAGSSVNLSKDQVLLMARPTAAALIEALKSEDTSVGQGDHKLAVFDPTPERIEKAIKIITKGKSWRNRNDIWYTNDPLLKNNDKICFLFPGLDALEKSDIESICEYFNIPRMEHAEASELIESSIKVFETSMILDQALKKLGIAPDLIAGHSLGEWLGCYSSGICDEKYVLKMLTQLDPHSINVPDVHFLVIGSGMDQIKPLIKDFENLYLTHDNCPHQVIVCGHITEIEKCKEILNEKQIFHQLLPFQSGFHSPFFEGYINQLRDKLFIIQKEPSIPLWSATTTELYPTDIEEIKELTLQHLTQPVRFRELVEKLHEQEGVKYFLQVGAGGLAGFTDDTLKGKSFQTISASSPKRTALNQLQRVLVSIFVEGKEIDIDFLNLRKPVKTTRSMKLSLGFPLVNEFDSTPIAPARQESTIMDEYVTEDGHPLLQSLHLNFNAINSAQKEISSVLKQKLTMSTSSIGIETPPSPPYTYQPEEKVTPNDFEKAMELSLEKYPYLIDHSMYVQKEGWPYMEDRFPVVPMTMLIELMADAVLEQVPGMQIEKIENIQAFKWTHVSDPIHLVLKGSWQDHKKVNVTLGDYATAQITVRSGKGSSYLSTSEDIGKTMTPTMTQEQIYEDKHMFHGPAYQGIKEFIKMGDKGIKGIIRASSGKGSLLDNAGQLFGLWIQMTVPYNHIAFPVKIKEINFPDNYNDQDGEFECTCHLTENNDDIFGSNITVNKNGKTWATINGWINRRLGFDPKMWDTSRQVLDNSLSEELPNGIFIFKDTYRRSTAWDFISKRYLSKPEKDILESLPLTRRKKWLMGRVVIKDIVRATLNKKQSTKLYPGEINIKKDHYGKPIIIGEQSTLEPINVSLAHKDKIAVAIASQTSEPGIDIESIEDRGEGFLKLSFHDSELALIPKDEDTWEWATRLWAAKEAYGKSIGKGLQGNPKNYKIEEVDGTSVRIEDKWIKSTLINNYVIGWIQ
ncbi:beta-ketoacyl synthase N-terminal-like domain-containing protein [Fulvivirga sediminis]|uniref:4'-phosphopantetheinyl transferase superfamily protein n=1 Tax=Fulvivirga sediminis TaxID=2803949 RepID=A0A937F704_9BACT|nr:beta-ketoacyl synthase N-terminal-like domain-containing protein [Fulvivirga sediminis]MBL3655485.1 4'-phosphopantetheinyl transferase superfamily protein [Fulvivirga sediminis]